MNTLYHILALLCVSCFVRPLFVLGFTPVGEGAQSIKHTADIIAYRAKINDELIGLLEKDEPTDAEEKRASDIEAELKRVDAELEKRNRIAEQHHRQQALEIEHRRVAGPTYRPNIGRSSSARDVEQFSVPRLLGCLLRGEPLQGIEREMIDEGQNEARSSDIHTSRNGVMIPSVALLSNPGERRDMTATGGTGLNQGGMTIPTLKAPLLDDLFNRNVLVQAGMTTYSGLVGNLDIPRLIKGTDPVHKTENAAADETSPTTAQLSLTPRRLPVFVDISRQLFLQSQERNLETTIRRHIVGQLNEIIQRMLINGAGSGSAQPVGILGTSGIGAGISLGANGGAPTYASIVDLETKVAIEDADLGSLHYLTNAKVRGKLKTTARVASTDSVMILDDANGGMLNGYTPLFTNGVPSNLVKVSSGTVLSALIFGNFADLVMAQWSGIEFILDEVTQAGSGLIRLHAAIYYDGGVQRPASFAASQEIATT